jgi:hypothetical protein
MSGPGLKGVKMSKEYKMLKNVFDVYVNFLYIALFIAVLALFFALLVVVPL